MAGFATGTGQLSIQCPLCKIAKFWSVVPRIQLKRVVSQELIVGEEDLVRAVFVKSVGRL